MYYCGVLPTNSENYGELLTPPQFGRRVSAHPNSVLLWAKRGLIQFVRMPSGRIKIPASEEIRIKNGAPLPETERGA